jgi:hypothetical protein
LHPARFRSFGRAAEEEVLFIRVERGFQVAGIRGDGLRQFGSVLHGKVGPFARRSRQAAIITEVGNGLLRASSMFTAF